MAANRLPTILIKTVMPRIKQKYAKQTSFYG